jgi:hypothetical protein
MFMRKAILGYSLQSMVISFVLAISYFVFYKYGFPQFYTPFVFVLIGLLFAINVVFHSFFVHTVVKKNEAFVRRYLASTMLKLLVYLAVILVMIFSGQPRIKIILISFLVFYIVFTVHEIYTILEFLKKNSSQNVKSK